jgi:UDP-N-acetylmuramate dehydrogenase
VETIPDVFSILDGFRLDVKILGAGSNLLVEEGLLNFIVIDLTDLNGYGLQEDRVFVQPGISLRKLSRVFAQQGLSGLEFAAGIPGTVGGAVVMNAGAYGSQMSDVVLEVTVFDTTEKRHITYSSAECGFSYRYSRFLGKKQILTRIVLRKENGDSTQIRAKIAEYELRRVEKQPLELRSAGSIFKKPETSFHVGQVIEAIGMKGFRIGGARVSPLHAGFIVNDGSATYSDIRNLIKILKQKIFIETGRELELEICIWEK